MSFEKLYAITNPLDCVCGLITENELKTESSALKDVFDLSFADDIKKRIHFDSAFRRSIMETYNVDNDTEAFECIIKLASIDDIEACLDLYVSDFLHNSTETIFNPPFPTTIELEEGLFAWDDAAGYYKSA